MKCRIRGFVISIISLFIMVFLLSDIANAKLVVLSPEAMIESSDFIFTGKVVEKNYTEEQRTVKIEIDRILKGNENISELTLTRQKPKMYGWLGFDFPEVGNKVFVLLNKSKQEYMPNFDLNYVAIVNEDDKIELYNGNSINGVGKEEYATVYEKFLKENHSKAIIPKKNALEQKVDKEIQLSEVSDNNDDKRPFMYILLSAATIVIILSLSFFVKRKKCLS